MDGLCICRCDGDICDVCRQISDAIISVRNLGQIMGYVDIYLKCVGLFFIPLTVVNVYRNGIQGMGFGILPMMAGVAELIGRGVVAIGAAHYKSYVGSMSGKSCGMGAGRRAAACDVFSYHEEVHGGFERPEVERITKEEKMRGKRERTKQ